MTPGLVGSRGVVEPRIAGPAIGITRLRGTAPTSSRRPDSAYAQTVAHNAKRGLAWFGLAVLGVGIAAAGTQLERPASGLLVILGIIIGLVGVVGARMNTDAYDFDQQRRDRHR